jgi:hypothetical protein
LSRLASTQISFLGAQISPKARSVGKLCQD